MSQLLATLSRITHGNLWGNCDGTYEGNYEGNYEINYCQKAVLVGKHSTLYVGGEGGLYDG